MTKKKKQVRRTTLAPDQIGVKSVATSDLRANPHNPRMLFDREPMRVLRESIEKVGILVPLTVYQGRNHTKLTILDGQRRWMCAQELGLEKVPVNQVAQPSTVQNIVTMFQIHKLREDWELMPTALKLELLMEKLKERGERRLAELTGLDVAVVTRCKKLLSYAAKYQEMMLEPDPKQRLKADFFIELYAVRNDRTVAKMPWFKRDNFTQRMLDKYRNRASDLKSVTDFRKVKQYVNDARRAKKLPSITKRLREYTLDDNLKIEHLAIASAEAARRARDITRAADNLLGIIGSLSAADHYGQDELWLTLERLHAAIGKKLKEADRRQSR